MVAPWTDVAAAVLLAIQFQEITFPGPVRLVCGFHFWHDSWARCHCHYSQTEIELHILCLPKAFCRISSPHLAISLWPLFLSLLELFAPRRDLGRQVPWVGYRHGASVFSQRHVDGRISAITRGSSKFNPVRACTLKMTRCRFAFRPAWRSPLHRLPLYSDPTLSTGEVWSGREKMRPLWLETGC